MILILIGTTPRKGAKWTFAAALTILLSTPLTILIGAIGAEPMLEKWDRIKNKLGLIVQPDYFTNLAYRFYALRQKQRKKRRWCPKSPPLMQYL